ncbi:MAG: 2-phosphosulfolactate phosphatase [Candidatus Humimicrobiaceae bacterium]
MIIDIALNNDFTTSPKHVDVSKYVCGVIDVIRATTTISVMLAKGANEVVIAKNKSQAFLLKKIFKNYFLCGEEGGLPPKGFDFGNSPLEYSSMNLEGKGIILKTTNGTKSFFKTINSRSSFALSLVNVSYTCDAIIYEAEKNGLDILLLCSGEKGKIAYDDAYTAGFAVKILREKRNNMILSDAALIVLNNAKTESNTCEALKRSVSYRSMVRAGLGDDLKICCLPDLYEITGRLHKHKEKTAQNFKEGSNAFKNSNIFSNIFVIKPYKL